LWKKDFETEKKFCKCEIFRKLVDKFKFASKLICKSLSFVKRTQHSFVETVGRYLFCSLVGRKATSKLKVSSNSIENDSFFVWKVNSSAVFLKSVYSILVGLSFSERGYIRKNLFGKNGVDFLRQSSEISFCWQSNCFLALDNSHWFEEWRTVRKGLFCYANRVRWQTSS